MTRTPKRVARLALAVALVVPTVIVAAGLGIGRRPHQGRGRGCRRPRRSDRPRARDRDRAVQRCSRPIAGSAGQARRGPRRQAKPPRRSPPRRSASSKTERSRRTPAPAPRWTCCWEPPTSRSSPTASSSWGRSRRTTPTSRARRENAQQQAEWAADRYAETIEEKTDRARSMEANAGRDRADARAAEGARRSARPASTGSTSSARKPRRRRRRRPKQKPRSDTGRAVAAAPRAAAAYAAPQRERRPQIAIGAADSASSARPTSGALPGPTRSTARASRAGRTRRPASTCRTLRPHRRASGAVVPIAVTGAAGRPAVLLQPDQPRRPLRGRRHDGPRAPSRARAARSRSGPSPATARLWCRIVRPTWALPSSLLRLPARLRGVDATADTRPATTSSSSQRLREGDEDAFMSLVERLQPMMLRVARMYVSSQAVAEEVVQEAWLGVLQGIDRFEGRSSLRTWILRIVEQHREDARASGRVAACRSPRSAATTSTRRRSTRPLPRAERGVGGSLVDDAGGLARRPERRD